MVSSRGSLGRWGWRGLSALGTVGALLAMQGCLIVVDEGDATIEGAWTIDGLPASTSTCNAAGIDNVDLVLYGVGSSSEALRLRNTCASGVIDSRLTDTYIVAGDYEFTFEALQGSTAVGRSERSAVRLISGDHRRVTANFLSGGGFDPRGTGASLEASWLVDGGRPSAADCTSLGVSRVRVAFQNGSDWYEHPSLVANCADGVIDTGDTAVIAVGTWTIQLQALSATGSIVANGPLTNITITPDTHVQVDPLNFVTGAFNPMGVDATAEASWTLNGRAPTADTCFAIGVDTVDIVLYAATDTDFEHGVAVATANCVAGRIDTRPTAVVRTGSYLVALEALDSEGRLVEDYTEMTPLDVTPGSHLLLPVIDFGFPTTLTIELGWQSPTSPTSFLSCTDAGVSIYSYTLRRDGVTIASIPDSPCQELISFDTEVTPGFTPGTYSLWVEGGVSSGSKAWGSSCDAIGVMDGSLVFEECDVRRP